jgi:hypothetical protein
VFGKVESLSLRGISGRKRRNSSLVQRGESHRRVTCDGAAARAMAAAAAIVVGAGFAGVRLAASVGILVAMRRTYVVGATRGGFFFVKLRCVTTFRIPARPNAIRRCCDQQVEKQE